MRRRPGFTLIEMLVSVALVLFIMVILTEAFGKGLESFRTLKALGDMEGKLRSALAVLRRDLGADHFEGKRRLSDDVTTWRMTGKPREGFFRHEYREPAALYIRPTLEGADADQVGSTFSAASVLHFTVKLRGNDRGEFFTARMPQGLVPRQTTFFNQPADARFQENTAVYQSQWAEVAYFLEHNGTFAGSTPLYTLYRSQFVLVADNSTVNWTVNGPNYVLESVQNSDELDEISCRPREPQLASPRQRRSFYVNNPTDINGVFQDANQQTTPQHPHRRAFDPLRPTLRAATPILTDVLSFDVHDGESGLAAVAGSRFPLADTHPLPTPGVLPPRTTFDRSTPPNPKMIGITLRVWDAKTKQSRQMTIFQDL